MNYDQNAKWKVEEVNNNSMVFLFFFESLITMLTLFQVCDDSWHHYAVSVSAQGVQLTLDGELWQVGMDHNVLVLEMDHKVLMVGMDHKVLMLLGIVLLFYQWYKVRIVLII